MASSCLLLLGPFMYKNQQKAQTFLGGVYRQVFHFVGLCMEKKDIHPIELHLIFEKSSWTKLIFSVFQT